MSTSVPSCGAVNRAVAPISPGQNESMPAFAQKTTTVLAIGPAIGTLKR